MGKFLPLVHRRGRPDNHTKYIHLSDPCRKLHLPAVKLGSAFKPQYHDISRNGNLESKKIRDQTQL